MRRGRVFAASLLAVVVAVAALILSAAPGSAAPHAAARHAAAARSGPRSPNRYSLVHGCYALRSGGSVVGAADGPYRMQAAALGQYLLYGVHDDFLGSNLSPVSVPGSSTVWQVDGTAGRGFTLTNLGTGRALPVSFTAASGCAVFPEGGVNASGSTFTGASPLSSVNGTVDAHTHVTAFEFLGGAFHCGRPWSP